MSSAVGIDLFWLPLGAGGHFVRLNGRVFEALVARRERRPALDLYHSALAVRVPAGRFTIETAAVIRDANGASRGVVAEGPVATRRLARFRLFRYEVRRWPDGTIPDVAEAVASPVRVGDDEERAQRLLELVGSVPPATWGRDELAAGEMWNSNSVVAWLLASSGVPTGAIRPPLGGRAPGWDAGLVVAARGLTGRPAGDASPAGGHPWPPSRSRPASVSTTIADERSAAMRTGASPSSASAASTTARRSSP